MRREFGDGRGKGLASGESRAQDNEIDGQGKQLFGFLREIVDAVANRVVCDGLPAKGVGDGVLIAFKKQLVDTIAFVEQAKRGFQAFRKTVDGGSIQAFVIDAPHFEDDAYLAGFREEDLWTDEAEQIDQRIERTGFLVVLEDPF